MKRGTKTRILALILTLVSLTAVACSGLAADASNLTTLTIYPANSAVPSGAVDGYKGEIFAEHGLKLEIWTYSDEKTNAILASGDLPDLMYVKYDQLQTMIESGMVLELDSYLEKIPLIAENDPVQAALNYTRQFRSADTGKVYGIPMLIGVQVETQDTGRNAVKVNWPVYNALGAPDIKDVWDLIPLMKKMMEAKPVADDGTPTWGTVLNAGADSTYWRSIELWYKWFGYELMNMPYLIETDMINDKYTSVLDLGRESLYYEGLKFYNTAYKEGVLDPDSINNDRETQKAKVEKSHAVMIPGGSTPGWAGYLPVHIPGQTLYQENWLSTYGANYYLTINAKTANLDACLKLLGLLADSDIFYQVWNGREEEGLWYRGDDGLVYPTEYGLEATVASARGEPVVFKNGEKQQLWLDDFIGDVTFARSYLGPVGFWTGPNGERRTRTMLDWDEVRAITDATEDRLQWKAKFGYEYFTQQLKAKNAYKLISELQNCAMFCPTPDDAMQLTLNAIKDVMVTGSWKMVYAEDEATFNAIWDQMMQDCKDLGAEQVVQWRLDELAKAMEIKNALEAK